jgi:hypothetical protein
MTSLDQQGPDVAHQQMVSKSYSDIKMSDNARGHFGDIYGTSHFADSETQTEMKQQSTITRSRTFPLPAMRPSTRTTDNTTQTACLELEQLLSKGYTSGLTVTRRAVFFG